MKAFDFTKALGVAIAVIVLTVASSFLMVAFYAYVIEPGHPERFYTEAAQWIAPWSSHILGPLLFLGFNYWLVRWSPELNAMLFAAVTIVLYTVVDLSLLPVMGFSISDMLTRTFFLSLSIKAAGALLGAYLGSHKRLSEGVSGDAT